MGKFVNELDSKMQTIDRARYRREQYQSFMTGPEWRNVEMAEEFATSLQEGKSMFQFPYFRQIADLWRVLYHSYSAARKYNSRKEIFFSEYMIMDLFVTLFTTLELTPKGILSLLLYPFLKKENKSPMQQHLANYFTNYAADLQTIPFYDHPYKTIRETLAKQYNECENHSWVDWFSWTAISIELRAKQLISSPLSYWFHQEGNEAPPSTDILVKFDAIGIDNPEQAKELFQERLTELAANHKITLVDDHLYAKETPKTKGDLTYTSVYARLTTPRYAAFQPAVRAMAEQGIHLRKIAGQDHVQVKCVVDTGDVDNLTEKTAALNSTNNVTALYTYSDRIHSNRQMCLFDVPVKNLHETLYGLDQAEDVHVNFIHNF